MTGFPLLADDTEIYLGDLDFSAEIRPNILFIIDTSGSMGTDVTVTTSAYDPATTYTGDCDAARVYWDNSGDPPDCDTNNWFEAASNVCADSSVSLTTGPGLYVGRLARYRGHKKGDYWKISLNKKSHTDLWSARRTGVFMVTDGGTYPADEDMARSLSQHYQRCDQLEQYRRQLHPVLRKLFKLENYSPGTSSTKTRLQIVQEVFSDVIDSTSGVNAGLMRFDNKSQELNKGGYFVQPMQELNDTSRPAFKTSVDAIYARMVIPRWPRPCTRRRATFGVKGSSLVMIPTRAPTIRVYWIQTDTTKYKTPIEYPVSAELDRDADRW